MSFHPLKSQTIKGQVSRLNLPGVYLTCYIVHCKKANESIDRYPLDIAEYMLDICNELEAQTITIRPCCLLLISLHFSPLEIP